ncbi:TonB-dependent receptor plug domain-containing protein, partial [Pseudomonas aeruginosa]|nr:TonB-dependent receptor plug domain-containing protein [Pseudomonas aeruginosa]
MHRSLHTDPPLGAALLLALQLAPSSAAAAEGQAPVDPPTVQLQRIEVTGSAIRRVDAETAVPISVLRAEELRQQGVTSTEELIGRLSGNQGVYNSSRSVGSATGGASFADLRGIGANKTLG